MDAKLRMKKIVAIVGANLLIAGGLAARAGWMIASGCNIDGTCRGSSNMLTWGLAVGPALILLVVLGLSAPKLLAGLAARREEKREMANERAEVATANAEVSEQGQNRLARLKRTVAEEESATAEPADFDLTNGYDPDSDDSDRDWLRNEPVADDRPNNAYTPTSDWAAEPAATESNPWADNISAPVASADDSDEIEREWLAAKAELDPAVTGYMAEPTEGGYPPADLPPAYVPAAEPVADLPTWQPPADDSDTSFRLKPLDFSMDDGDEAVGALNDAAPPVDSFTPTSFEVPAFDVHSYDASPAVTEDTSDQPQHGESSGWHIEAADPADLGLQANGQIWRPEMDEASDHASHEPAQPGVDIWARTAMAFEDEASEAVADEAQAAQASANLPPIDLPVIGRAPDEWAWLFADGLPLLRTSRATGFPWIAGGIGEVATAIQTSVALDQIGHFAAEAEAWVRIARSIPYAEQLGVEDAQGFVEWCNTLSVDLAASNQQDALCSAISEAMFALRGRARNDMETSLALPDAFDTSSGFGQSLSA